MTRSAPCWTHSRSNQAVIHRHIQIVPVWSKDRSNHASSKEEHPKNKSDYNILEHRKRTIYLYILYNEIVLVLTTDRNALLLRFRSPMFRKRTRTMTNAQMIPRHPTAMQTAPAAVAWVWLSSLPVELFSAAVDL